MTAERPSHHNELVIQSYKAQRFKKSVNVTFLHMPRYVELVQSATVDFYTANVHEFPSTITQYER